MSMDYATNNRNRVRHTIYVVQCKRCHRNVLAGVENFPTDNIVVDCPLCGDLRRYRPGDVYLGTPDPILARKPADNNRPKHLQYRKLG